MLYDKFNRLSVYDFVGNFPEMAMVIKHTVNDPSTLLNLNNK